MPEKRKLKLNSKATGFNFLTLRVAQGDKSELVVLEGGMDKIPVPKVFEFNGLTFEMRYGASEIPVPFQVKCRDFILDKYPGSNSPSSFASELTIIDTANNYIKDKGIFMNNVWDYNGYRLFQSGYDQDEGGTHLSVNHDYWESK